MLPSTSWIGPALRSQGALCDRGSILVSRPPLHAEAAHQRRGRPILPADSSQLYFDQLPGIKYLRYVPNTDHSLKNSDAFQTLGAWHFAMLTRTPLPQFSWKRGADGTLTVTTATKPAAVLLWQATNPTARDFRLEKIGPTWRSSPVDGAGGIYAATVPKPAEGWTAAFMELTFDIGAGAPLTLTTDVTITPDTLPFAARIRRSREDSCKRPWRALTSRRARRLLPG